jgi:hypothetical protein
MAADNPPDKKEPAVTPEPSQPAVDANPLTPADPTDLGGIVWDKIGTFTIRTSLPDDD